jgi:hypothetical protein
LLMQNHSYLFFARVTTDKGLFRTIFILGESIYYSKSFFRTWKPVRNSPYTIK